MNADKVMGWMKGNQDAARFVLALHQIVDTWDDLIDKDKSVSDSDIHAAFTGALIEIPRNPFYQANFMRLNPVIEAAIADWHTANALEDKKDEANLREAYVLRCSGYSVAVMCAAVVGGDEWAKKVNLELRSQPSEWTAYAAKHGVQ